MNSNESPLRIVHYVPAVRLEQGGVVRAVLDWCTVFARRGHQVSLVVYQSKDLPADWLVHQSGKPRAYLVPEPTPPLKLLGRGAMGTINELLQNADVLHLHGPWLDGNRQIAGLARQRGVPYLVSTHGMLDDWSMTQRGLKKKIYMSLFGRSILNRAATIHCTAEAELSQAKKWFDNPRTIILPYLVNLAPFEQLPAADAAIHLLPSHLRDLPRLLFLSRLHEQKGVDILIQAAGLLQDAGQPFVAMLAGTGELAYESYLRSLVKKLNLEDRVIFLGLLTGNAKLSAYSAADLFVLPTRHENFGLVLTEAMACGVPVVTTRGTDIWREIQTAGAIITDGTPREFADQIQKLLRDPTDRAARGMQGKQWVAENLAVEPLSLKYEELYRRISGVPASATTGGG